MAVNPIKVWNGTAWEYTGPVVAAPPVKYQATAPTSPATGDVWVESDYDVASVDPSKLLTGGVYTNESTRSAAIPTPTTGMVTYVGDTGTDSSTIPQIQAYTGAAWQNMDGSTLLTNTVFTGAATVTVDNVFTTRYDSYKVVLNCKNTTSNDVALNVQFRNGGSTIGGTAYTNNRVQSYGTFIGAGASTSAANWTLGNTSQNNYSQFVATISNPALALPKNIHFTLAHGQSTVNIDSYYGMGMNVTSTAYDGLIFTTVGTITGTLKVYGLRNS
jgi:hypothetical protein